MEFDLPADDYSLVHQVYTFFTEKSVSIGHTLLNIPRKYRFAGYIGSFVYLTEEINELKRDRNIILAVCFLNVVFTIIKL